MAVNAFAMRSPAQPLDMAPKANAFTNMTAPAPSPAPVSAAQVTNAFTPRPQAQPKAPAPNPAGNAFKAFATGFAGPEAINAVDDRHKADAQAKAKAALLWMQHTAQQPAERRAQFTLQSAQDIARDTGQPYEAIVASARDPNAFSDEALNGAIAKFSAMAGVAPSTPEPMSEYQREQVRLEELKMQQPKPSDYDYREIDGPEGPGTYAVNKADPSQMQFVGKAVPKLDPAKYDTVQLADGVYRINQNDPTDKVRVGPAPPKAGSGSDTAGTTKDPEFIRLEREYAKDWDRIQKDFSEVNTQYRRVKALGNLAATDKPARSAADLALVVTITKMLDPTSVAREGEVKLTASSASLVDQASNMLNQWKNGQTILPDATRASLLKMADTIFPSYSDAYENRKRDAYTTANEYGFSPKRTMMGADISEFDNMSDEEVQSIFDGIEQAAASPTGSGAVPTEAAAELMRDPSPEALAEFDDVFGAGMAQRVLNGSR